MNKEGCILIYGGAFDPIHIGHISSVTSVEKELKKLYEDVVVYLTISNTKHFNEDKNTKASETERHLALREIAHGLGDNYAVIVEKTPYMYDTIEWINTFDYDIILLIGQDQANSFDKWYRHEDILHMTSNIAIFNSDEGTFKIDDVVYEADNHSPIRSSQIREMIKNGLIEEAKSYVPKEAHDLLSFYKG